MSCRPLKQESEPNSESPLVRVLQRHFRRLSPDTSPDTEQGPSKVTHAPTGLSNPFWNSNGTKEQEER